jgi:hypothetical protein
VLTEVAKMRKLLAVRRTLIVGVPLLAGAVTAMSAAVRAAVAGASTGPGRAASPIINGELMAVAADSARDAWAVGATSSGLTLIEHWNGHAWKQVSS